MALLATRGETRLHVIRTGRVLEILHVARRAVGCCSDKLAVRVALRAGHIGVRAGQWELRKSIVVESRRIPSAGVVTSLASVRESSLRMRRIVGLVEVRHVAAAAGCRRARELSSGVAGIAVQGRVRSHQRKARDRKMVELRPHPVVHRVTLVAACGELESDVIQPGGSRIHEVPLMAGVARRRQTLELAHRRALVTGVAIHRGVRADQRKTV